MSIVFCYANFKLISSRLICKPLSFVKNGEVHNAKSIRELAPDLISSFD